MKSFFKLLLIGLISTSFFNLYSMQTNACKHVQLKNLHSERASEVERIVEIIEALRKNDFETLNLLITIVANKRFSQDNEHLETLQKLNLINKENKLCSITIKNVLVSWIIDYGNGNYSFLEDPYMKSPSTKKLIYIEEWDISDR